MKLNAATSSEAPFVAVLAYNLAATGVTQNAIRIAGHAARNGIRTQLWLWQKSGPFLDRVPEGVEVVEFGVRSGRFSFGFLRRLSIITKVPALAKLIAARRPDILLSAGNRCHIAASLAWRLAGKPVETTLVARASNATAMMAARGFRARLFNWLDALKYKGFHHVIAVSGELAANLATARRELAPRITVIPNGVDLEKFSVRARELPTHRFFQGKGPVLVSAGTITRQKNFPLLLDAVAILRAQHPDIKLIILGDGAQAARNKLLAKVHALRLDAHVDLAGYVANPASFFSHADAYVLSSSWEGASNSLLEALACGARVAATDCPTGIRELLHEGKQGSIAALGDPQALADAIARELAKPAPGRARKAWMEPYSLDKCLSAYTRFFKETARPGAEGL